MIAANGILKIPLPERNYLMKRLSSRSKIIGLIVALFVVVAMYFGHPFLVGYHALLGFYLGLPGPVPVQVVVVKIYPSAWPGFGMFPALGGGAGPSSASLFKQGNLR